MCMHLCYDCLLVAFKPSRALDSNESFQAGDSSLLMETWLQTSSDPVSVTFSTVTEVSRVILRGERATAPSCGKIESTFNLFILAFFFSHFRLKKRQPPLCAFNCTHS